jgi:hypothetical protein
MFNLSFRDNRTGLQKIIHQNFRTFEVSIHIQGILNQQMFISAALGSELLL